LFVVPLEVRTVTAVRDERLNLRLHRRELQLLEAAARRQGTTLSAFSRALLLRGAALLLAQPAPDLNGGRHAERQQVAR
jgi:uncharacterized protein (DUF1778 family)